MVHRAPQQRLREKSPADEGAAYGLYGSGCHVFRRRTVHSTNGADAARRAPPVNTAKRIGVPVGAGTDAHRVASYNPFTALQWFLDGKTVGGVAIRGPEETPNRADALRFYTIG